MTIKIIILLCLVLTVTKACDLDWVLEDIYDDTDSGEDESTEKPDKPAKPEKPESNTNKPSSTPAPDPNSSASITTKPFPIIPEVAASAPVNNSTASNSSSRALEAKPKRHHRRTHHRRHVIRRVPLQNNVDDQINPSEGRSFNSELDLFSLLGRKNLVREKGNTKTLRRVVPSTSSTQNKNVNEQGRSFTTRDFITESHVPVIELPEERTGSVDLGENSEAQDELDSEGLIRVLIGPVERKNGEGEVRSFTAHDFVPMVEIPKERMESLELGESDKEEAQIESDDTIKDDEQVRSFDAHDSVDDEDGEDAAYLEIPEGRMENRGLKQKIKRKSHSDNKHFIKLSLRLMPKRKIVRKRVRTPTTHLSKSDIRSYIREYLNKLRLHNNEEKMYESNEYVYIPVPKNILNKKHDDFDSSLIKNQKGSHLLSIINREFSDKLPEQISEEHVSPSITETWVYNRKPTKVQHLNDESHESYLTLMVPQASSEESEPLSSTHHVMLQNQNPRRPILINPYDSDIPKMVEEPHSDMKNPSINHVNQVKEHILRETIKVNPSDNSEIRNVYEQTRLSVIKNPNVPIDLTMEKHELADLSDSSLVVKKPEVHLMSTSPLVQQLPLMNSNIYDFQQKFPISNHNPNQGHMVEHQNLLVQELPLMNSQVNFLQGFSNNLYPMPTGSTKLSDIYLQSQSYPINYPINNPTIKHDHESHTMITEQLNKPIQEQNFYVKPQTPEIVHMQHNIYETLPANPALQHEEVSEQSQHDHQIQHLPLLDMIHNFKGHHSDGSMQKQEAHLGESTSHDAHHGSAVETSTPPVKHTIIKNAV